MKDFQYDLPPDRIAPYPLPERDRSRLLVFRDGLARTAAFSGLPDFLDPGDLLVLNKTRVVQARLVFYKASGARIEVFCLHPHAPESDVQLALGLPSPVTWECLVGNAKKWREGRLELRHEASGLVLQAELCSRAGEGHLIHFSWTPPGLGFGQVLELAGLTPLPPYIRRAAEPSDKKTYQTVYAREEGSVAAPTAGLHFTPALFRELEEKGIRHRFLTLHVGAGTFKPVSSPRIGGHQMHQEQFMVERSLLDALLERSGRLVAVGTTSMRTLESLYWIGCKILQGHRPPVGDVLLEQWFPYQWNGPLPSSRQCLQAVADYMDRQEAVALQGETALIIVPGYRFQLTDALVTNFHQPGSTLLLLVAAFAGPGWKAAYRHALDHGYRFLSYGDGSLFFRQDDFRPDV
jgi:S-adenosylmethionine:tRNA ribosyltransferase-isomerase